LAGARSYAAIAQWAADAEDALAVRPDAVGKHVPAHPGPRGRARLGGGAAAGCWAAALRPSSSPGAGQTAVERRSGVAVDGKTLRDARQPDATQTKLVCVYDHASPLVLTQAAVAGGDEIAALITVLDILPDLDGTLLTADALHCQRDHVPFLADRGGHYLVTVEANEPLLRRELARLPWGSAPGQRRYARGHGRTEARSIKVIDLDGTGAQALFPRAVRAIEVVRRRRRMRNRASVEIVYAVTSLTYRQVHPGL
jgi:Transposase DDE domain